MKHRPRALLFDLDGTLADTAPDLIAAVNRLRVDLGFEPVAPEVVRPHVSKGGRAMLNAGLTELRDDDGSLLKRFLDHYRAAICIDTRLFDGIGAVLDRIEARGLPWGIVTNKPGWLTAPLIEALALHRRCRIAVSGDTLPVRKPDPAPIRHACAALGVDPVATAMIGDDARDLEAARAAGALAVFAAWGYRTAEDDPASWPADLRVATPHALLEQLGLAP